MNDFEFVKFESTPAEKHMGIATIKAYNKIVLRYKIVKNKEGNGYFPACASYKITRDGEDFYVSAFVIDSRSEEEEINQVIRNGIKKFMNVPSKDYTTLTEEVPF